MTARSPTFGQLLREAMDARLADLHVSMPCKVVSYNSSKNTVTVQPLLKRKRRDAAGAKIVTSMKTIQNVPVAFPRCAGGWITFPLAADDIGQLVFAERTLNDWMKSNPGDEVEPSEDTMHPLNGAWFYPGGYPSKSPIDPTNADHPVFHTESELHLGEQGLSNDQFVAIAKLVKDEISALRNTVNSNVTVFNTHTHPSGMGPTGTPASAESSPAAVGDVKATKVKAK